MIVVVVVVVAFARKLCFPRSGDEWRLARRTKLAAARSCALPSVSDIWWREGAAAYPRVVSDVTCVMHEALYDVCTMHKACVPPHAHR